MSASTPTYVRSHSQMGQMFSLHHWHHKRAKEDLEGFEICRVTPTGQRTIWKISKRTISSSSGICRIATSLGEKLLRDPASHETNTLIIFRRLDTHRLPLSARAAEFRPLYEYTGTCGYTADHGISKDMMKQRNKKPLSVWFSTVTAPRKDSGISLMASGWLSGYECRNALGRFLDRAGDSLEWNSTDVFTLQRALPYNAYNYNYPRISEIDPNDPTHFTDSQGVPRKYVPPTLNRAVIEATTSGVPFNLSLFNPYLVDRHGNDPPRIPPRFRMENVSSSPSSAFSNPSPRPMVNVITRKLEDPYDPRIHTRFNRILHKRLQLTDSDFRDDLVVDYVTHSRGSTRDYTRKTGIKKQKSESCLGGLTPWCGTVTR